MGGFFQAAQAAKRRAWGGNPNKIPIGQNERLAKFGTVVESCSKKVAASSVWAFVNTFSAASGDFAKATAIFGNFSLPALHGQLADLPNRRGNFFLSPFARHNTGDFSKCQKWA